MSRALPTGRTGQALALALIIVVLAIFWLAVVQPLVDWRADRAETLVRRIALAQRMESLVATHAGLPVQAPEASGAGATALLDGDTDAVASAALQELLQAMFSRNGIPLNTVETLPGEGAGASRRIGLRISFNASWPVFMALLGDVEVARPAVFMDELQVQPALHRISTAPGTFDISCMIFAFRSESAKVAGR